MSKRPTNTAMADALKAAAAKMPAAKAAPRKAAPLQIITGKADGYTRTGKPKADIWLSGALLKALTNKYGDDVDGVQRGADWMVAEGMVKVPEGWSLKAIRVKAFGGKISVVAEDPATAWSPKAPAVVIEGLPD